MYGNNEREMWRDIAGYEGRYRISNFGNVRSLFFENERNVSKWKKPNGYLCVTLKKNGNKKSLYVHRLVAQAFIENKQNFPQVNHINENKEDNNACNLEWCTAKYNVNFGNGIKRRNSSFGYKNRVFDKDKMARRKKFSVIQLDVNDNVIKVWKWAGDFVKETGIGRTSGIYACCRGKRNTAYGFKWRFESGQ